MSTAIKIPERAVLQNRFPTGTSLAASAPGTTFFWMRENYQRAHRAPILHLSNGSKLVPVRADDLGHRRELTILDVMSRIESRVKKGGTQEAVSSQLAAVCGDAAKHIVAFRLGHAKGAFGRTLFCDCDHPGWAMELRRFEPSLVARLSTLNIRHVRFVG